MATLSRATCSFVAAIGLLAFASASYADVTVSATQQRDNKADHDKWNKTSTTEKKSPAKSEDSASADEAKTARAELSPKHKGELNGHLHMGDW